MDFRTASANSQTFVYSDSGGDGPLVVMFHGFPDLPFGWSDARDALVGAGHRVVVPYLRGYHPDTIVRGRRYGSKEIGEDAIRLLDAIEAERAVLVGHDWGAAVVYRAAALAPDRVRAICAVAIPHPNLIKPSPGLLWGGRHFLTLRVPTGPWLMRRNELRYVDTLIARWAPNWSGPARDACSREVKDAFRDDRVLDGALSYYRHSSPGGAERLGQPALIVGGTADIISPQAFKRSPECFTGKCDVVIADGAGHWPHREASDLFHERLLAFLADLG
jgi:pimeloyl-ACP methyl ester carboxylesterase